MHIIDFSHSLYPLFLFIIILTSNIERKLWANFDSVKKGKGTDLCYYVLFIEPRRGISPERTALFYISTCTCNACTCKA